MEIVFIQVAPREHCANEANYNFSQGSWVYFANPLRLLSYQRINSHHVLHISFLIIDIFSQASTYVPLQQYGRETK